MASAYKWIRVNDIVQRISDGAFIPALLPDAEGNRDYVKFKEWMDEGNVPDPPDPDVVG